MIVSKPKSNAIFAIGVFVIICFALGGYNFRMVVGGSASIFNWVMAVVFLLVAHILMFRQLFNYKIISIGEEKIQVWYPLRFRTVRGNLKDMDYWEETIIQTKTGVYRQLEVSFPKRKIKLSVQENTKYTEAVNYFKKKQPKKRKK